MVDIWATFMLCLHYKKKKSFGRFGIFLKQVWDEQKHNKKKTATTKITATKNNTNKQQQKLQQPQKQQQHQNQNWPSLNLFFF